MTDAAINTDAGSAGLAAEATATGVAAAAMNSAAAEYGASVSAATGTDAGDSTATADTGVQSADGTAQTGVADDGNAGLVEYSDFTVPEGVALNRELLGEFTDLAKGMKIDQAQAQQIIDLGVKLTQKLSADQAAAQEAQQAQWLESAKTDKEFGGEKLDENLAIAARAVNAFVSPALKALFDQTGLGNHPDMIRAFVKAGKLISEDMLLPGGTKPAPGNKSAASTLYPNQN